MRRLVVTLALLTLLALPSGATALTLPTLQSKLAREMRLTGARGSAFVEELSSGRVLFASRADVARPPAPVNKLFTTATALLRFGPEATFDTRVMATARPDADGVLRGHLFLRGGGDPPARPRGVGARAPCPGGGAPPRR